MISILLQIWGGGFYLLNKIFFSLAERSADEDRKRSWKVRSWSVYLIGLPAWVIIFVDKRNWIAAALESGGAAAMILGLVIATKGADKAPKWLGYSALIVTVIGITYSLYDFGGITTLNQVLELGVVTGFLAGTYLLAKQRALGYLLFVLMNVSNAALMYIQDFPWLALQQIVSLGFVLDAYRTASRADASN